MMNNAERKLRKARAQVVQSHPFFGGLLLRQRLVESTDIDTMATNGKELFYNATFIEGIRPDELQAVCAHEALHPGLLHHTRRGNRDHNDWNRACDYAINPILVDAGFHLPDCALLEDAYRGMSAEKIYSLIHSDDPDGGDGDDDQDGDGGHQQNDFGGTGSVMDAPDIASPAARAQEENNWRIAVGQASNLANENSAGQGGGSLQRAIDSVLNAKADWRELLRRYMDQFAKEDYTWSAPNRRFVGSGVYLPSMRSLHMGGVVFVIDASSSMPDASLRVAGAELQSMLSDLAPAFVDVVVHDDGIRHVQRYEPGETIDLNVVAGGGTSFAPVCEHVNAMDESPAVVVWFTDLEAFDWDQCIEPDAPILWLDYSGINAHMARFGDDVVSMETAS